MKHTRLSAWLPRILILVLLLTCAGMALHSGAIHLDGLSLVLGGAGVVQAIPTAFVLPDSFNVGTLTDSVNKMPGAETKIGDSGLFVEDSVSTTNVVVEEYQGRLSLVKAKSRNDDPEPMKRDVRKIHTLQSVHLPQEDVVLPHELQDVRGFGEVTNEQAQAKVINDKLQRLKGRLTITREWHRMGALRGQVLDSDGSVILDLFTEWGVAKATKALGLNVGTTDVRAALMDPKRKAEAKLGGVAVSGWWAYCSASFMDSLTGHAKVREDFLNWQASSDRNASDVRKEFVYGGIKFIEYNLTVGSNAFIPDDKAILFPVSRGIYRQVNTPANYNETVNTMGLPFYAKMEERRMGKGWDLEAQSNPVTFAEYPEAITELSIA